MNIDQLATVIKGLSENDLQELVSHLSNDFAKNETEITASTMETMVYAFNTSRYHIDARREVHTMREQAHLFGL